jgi:hypothetical protein
MMLKTFVIACLSVVVLASGAFAQTTPPPPSSNQGAFDKLSPGNQKIAQALFDAEQNDSTTKTLSRDDIAAMKQDGKGWGEIFKDMKQQGLVDAKNLGQVVSQANLATRSRHNGTVITSGSGRSYVAGARPKSDHSSADVRKDESGDDRMYRAHRADGDGDRGGQSASAGQQNYSGGMGRESLYGNSNFSGGGSGNAGSGGHGGRGRN